MTDDFALHNRHPIAYLEGLDQQSGRMAMFAGGRSGPGRGPQDLAAPRGWQKLLGLGLVVHGQLQAGRNTPWEKA